MTEPIKNLNESYVVSPKRLRQSTLKRTNAKIEEICEQLRALALEKGPGSKLPTVRELCSLLNTSNATLIAALDVLETEHILMRKERQGVFVSETINHKVIHIVFNISCLAEESHSPFWSLLWAQLTQETEHRATYKNENYHFHFICQPFGHPLPEDYLALLNLSKDCGCIIIGANVHTYEHEKLLHVPHVSFAGGGDITISLDDKEKVRLAAQVIQQQQLKKIACWVPNFSGPTGLSKEFFDIGALKHELAKCAIPIYPELFRSASDPSSFKRLSLQEQGYLLAKETFSATSAIKPDCVYIADDMLTSGAFIAWEELGIRVGEDLAVISHGTVGSPILFGRSKQITIIEFNPTDLVRAMFAHLDEAMRQGYVPQDQEIFIRPRLHART